MWFHLRNTHAEELGRNADNFDIGIGVLAFVTEHGKTRLIPQTEHFEIMVENNSTYYKDIRKIYSLSLSVFVNILFQTSIGVFMKKIRTYFESFLSLTFCGICQVFPCSHHIFVQKFAKILAFNN